MVQKTRLSKWENREKAENQDKTMADGDVSPLANAAGAEWQAAGWGREGRRG